MNVKKMAKEDLELLSYTDIAYYLLEDSKHSLTTPTIFKEICELLGYSDETYAAKIGDFYTSLTTDKRFIWLENNEWDLRDKHAIKISVDELEEEIEIDETDEDEEEYEEVIKEEESFDVIDETEDVDTDDDLEDLTLLSEDELEEEN